LTHGSGEQPTTQGVGGGSTWLPPRVVIRAIWAGHRAIHRFTGGRRGLAHPKPGGQFGYLRLNTIGRRSGNKRAAILGYIEDGSNLATIAMNGWADPDPAWWLNLQARPDATVELKGGGSRAVCARKAEGAERERLLARLHEHSGYGDIDAFTRRRSSETAVVVFEPSAAGRSTGRTLSQVEPMPPSSVPPVAR
jgi:deazaflavin-dependent oxidoreductase (nitroreductase family)